MNYEQMVLFNEVVDEIEATTQADGAQENVDAGQSEETQTPASGEESVQQPEVKTYTDDEALQALQNGMPLDSNRLTPQQKLIQKEFERGTTKAFQAAAEAKRQYEQRMASVQNEAAPSDPKVALYKAYLNDPMSVTEKFNSELEMLHNNRAEALKRFDTNTVAELDKGIFTLEKTLRDFETKRSYEINQANYSSNLVNQARASVIRDIPDYDQVAPALTEFATNSGLDPRVVTAMTNPVIMDSLSKGLGLGISGAEIVRQVVSAINGSYRLANASRSAEAKVAKPVPPRVVQSQGSTTGSTASSQITDESYQSEWNRAMRTGDWTRVLEMRGAL